MTAIFEGIAAIAGAIPVIDKWLQQFIAWYFNNQLASMRSDILAAVKKAIEEQDQRDLEKQMGSTKAGEPSGIPGTVIRDSLPGVQNTNKTGN